MIDRSLTDEVGGNMSGCLKAGAWSNVQRQEMVADLICSPEIFETLTRVTPVGQELEADADDGHSDRLLGRVALRIFFSRGY